MDGASSVSKGTGQFSFGKLMGKNCMEAIFPRFPGFRGPLPAPLPYGNGNGLQATLPPFQSGVGLVRNSLKTGDFL